MWICSCCCSPLRCWFLLSSLLYLRFRLRELSNCSSKLLKPRHAIWGLGGLYSLYKLRLPWVTVCRCVVASILRICSSLRAIESTLIFLLIVIPLFIFHSHCWRIILWLLSKLLCCRRSLPSIALSIHLLTTAQACGARYISVRRLSSSCLIRWSLSTALFSRYKLILLPLHIEDIGSPPWREALTTHLWGQTFFTIRQWHLCRLHVLWLLSHHLTLFKSLVHVHNTLLGVLLHHISTARLTTAWTSSLAIWEFSFISIPCMIRARNL